MSSQALVEKRVVKKQYPFWLGGVAACIAASITHPLDLTKVRMQALHDPSMIHSMQRTISLGGVTGLWDGITGTWMRQMSYSLCRFSVYEYAKGKLAPSEHGAKPAAWRLALSGSIAGGVAGVVGNPAEIVLVRMQADEAKPVEKQFRYKHCFNGLFRMINEEGFSSVTRGLLPNVSRSILMNASQLPAYDWCKGWLISSGITKDGMVCHFMASFAAGTIATTVCAPADVLKSRIMNASTTQSTLSVLRESILHEGPRVLFKGWLPAWVRLQPTTILTFLVLEQLRNWVDLTRI